MAKRTRTAIRRLNSMIEPLSRYEVSVYTELKTRWKMIASTKHDRLDDVVEAIDWKGTKARLEYGEQREVSRKTLTEMARTENNAERGLRTMGALTVADENLAKALGESLGAKYTARYAGVINRLKSARSAVTTAIESIHPEAPPSAGIAAAVAGSTRDATCVTRHSDQKAIGENRRNRVPEDPPGEMTAHAIAAAGAMRIAGANARERDGLRPGSTAKKALAQARAATERAAAAALQTYTAHARSRDLALGDESRLADYRETSAKELAAQASEMELTDTQRQETPRPAPQRPPARLNTNRRDDERRSRAER